MPDDRAAEDRRENHEREERYAEDQEQRNAIVKQPMALAPGNAQKSGL
jgi:hypothetical protein